MKSPAKYFKTAHEHYYRYEKESQTNWLSATVCVGPDYIKIIHLNYVDSFPKSTRKAFLKAYSTAIKKMDEAWSLVSSCTRCSEGCSSCWALAMEKRFKKGVEGVIETHPERLDRPLKRRKPTVYALWNDAFHPDVPFMFQQHIYETMQETKRHAYLILTKRPEIMARRVPEIIINLHRSGLFLDNVYHGLTVCTQQEWNEKGELLLSIPGKKFLSHEPGLERIDYGPRLKEISCLIAGGETGAKARPSHPDIFRSNRDQCQAAGVPFFFKSWGEWSSEDGWYLKPSGIGKKSSIVDFALGEYVRSKSVGKIGRKAAGRVLDGVTHDDLPW